MSAADRAFRLLLKRGGIRTDELVGSVQFSGKDPVVPSRHLYGAATAAALAANAAAVAILWRLRGGRPQDIEIDLNRAVNIGLRTVILLRQNGHSFAVGGSNGGERKFFRTSDGRSVYLLRNTGRGTVTQDLVGLLGASNNTQSISDEVNKWNGFDLEEALAEHKIPGVVVRSPQEWLQHPQGRLLAEQPGFSIQKIGASPREPLAAAARPLDGLRILDASHVIAGPSTSRLLAEQGGDVLHVVNPAEAETIPVHIDTNFGKRSAFIDLNQVEDVAQLKKLAATADIFIESFRPGAMRRRGFGPKDLAALRPGIIYASISCYGDDGPWASRGGYEPIGQAVSGLSLQEGYPGMPRNAPTGTMNDHLVAYLAGAGIMAALLRRCREGGSYHVTTSLTQASMWVLAQGQLSESANPPNIATYVPGPNAIETVDTVFGTVEHAAPLVRYSETQAHWTKLPQPRGSSKPVWLD